MSYEYHGDLNIENGGMFLDFAEFEKWEDFIPAVKITDLDSGCGFDTAIMVEIGSIYTPKESEKRKKALSCCGWDNLPESEITPLMLAESFDAYWGLEGDYSIIIQTQKDGLMTFDNWVADPEYSLEYWESGETLKEFIESKFL